MLKWLVGIFALIIVLIAGAGWWGYSKYQKFTAGGNSTRTVIAATPARIFASVANGDSLNAWLGSETTVMTSRHGTLQPGDRLDITTTNSNGHNSSHFSWTVTEVRDNQLLVTDIRGDSGKVMATRRDSLVTMGDSTVIITTFSSPMFEAAQTKMRDSARRPIVSALLGAGAKVAIAALRLENDSELGRLKTHLESGSGK